MSDETFQAVLFEDPDESGHWFYVVTDMSSYKPGHAASTDKRMRDRQFRHTQLVGKYRCSCDLPPDHRTGHPTCVEEIKWEHAHKRARLKEGEWYMPTAHVTVALRWVFRGNDRAMAIIDQVERNHRQAAG